MPGSEPTPEVAEPLAGDEPSTLDTSGHSTINIRNLSIRCGRCNTYQTLAHFERRGDWNVYSYECDNGTCDPAMTRTYLEVPVALDEFANRDPNWRGGKKHAGSENAE